MFKSEELSSGIRFGIQRLEGAVPLQAKVEKDKFHNIQMRFRCSGFCFVRHVEGNPVSFELGIYIPFSFLMPYFQGEDIQQVYSIPANGEYGMESNMQMLVMEILQCRHKAGFRNIYLEGKALELLLGFPVCGKELNGICEGICNILPKNKHLDQVMLARQLLLDRLSNPPTIAELSLQVGINQCYLKRGFKDLMGCTVYDFIQEQRMQKARLLLSTSGYTVTEVAEEVGFSSAGNFSLAFKKYTGLMPSELQRLRA